MSPPNESRYAHGPDVLARVLDGEAVLLNLATGKYFGLTPVATRAWELFGEGKTLGEARAALLTEFEVAPEVLDADLAELVEELATRGLIQPA